MCSHSIAAFHSENLQERGKDFLLPLQVWITKLLKWDLSKSCNDLKNFSSVLKTNLILQESNVKNNQ